MDKSNYQRTVLSNGLRIVTEFIPHVRSIAIGFWFDTGSRDEVEDYSGIAHFLEHMNFKGTSKRSAGQIAREIEGRGGILNAFTSKEVTCYHARVVDEQTARAVDVLSDITHNSLFDPKEIDRERDVILEELKNVEDTPDDLVFEHFMSQVYPNHPLGRPVLGNTQSLQTIHNDNLSEFCTQTYHGKRVVIAAAGRLNHKRLVRMIEKRLGNTLGIDQRRISPVTPEPINQRQDLHTATQQAHIVWGCRGLSYSDQRKYVLFILSTLLGGGMSSRLFQTIREKYGLAYSVYSFMDNYQDSGLFGIYAGTQPERAEKALKLIRKEIHKLVAHPVSARELQRTKDQLKGNIVLGLESPNSHMHRLAKMEILTGKWVPIDDVITQIEAVTSEDIQLIAKELFEEQALFTTVLWPN
ncbi:MAG: insulinase family protein [Calditrichaeota bacterium]|nr:insulinase family protein [Calditrichota bacterium]